MGKGGGDRARIYKLLRVPGIESKESISPAWRAGTTTLFLLGSYSTHRLFKNSSTGFAQHEENITFKEVTQKLFELPKRLQEILFFLIGKKSLFRVNRSLI
jgi:hypothetical protein